MKPVDIQICLGTTCFVMGGGHLQDLAETLPRRFGDKVQVTCVRCLGACDQSAKFSQAPYVSIDGEILSNATESAIMEQINRKVAHG